MADSTDPAPSMIPGLTVFTALAEHQLPHVAAEGLSVNPLRTVR